MSSRFLPVYRVVRGIPRGRVMTYGGIARALGWRSGARMVGWAMHHCPSGQGFPWHRVVGAGGRILLGEPAGLLQMRLLESEGVQIRERRVDLRQFGWCPPTSSKRGRRMLQKRSRSRRTRSSSR